MIFQLFNAFIVVSFCSGFFNRAVHTLNLPVGLRTVNSGCFMPYTMVFAGQIKPVSAFGIILHYAFIIGELCPVVG